MLNPPRTPAEQSALLKRKKHLLKSKGPKGRFLRKLFADLKEYIGHAKQKAEELEPFQFWKPSYEQSLMLNCWMYGISFICVYSANRIGKTTCMIMNMLLWIIPNNPEWKIFEPYTDHLGRHVQVFPRPDISALKRITKLLKEAAADPDLPLPDPRQSHTTKNNLTILQWLQNQSGNKCFKPAWPNPPWDASGTIWFGGPDQDHHEDILLPLWKKCIPEKALERYVLSSRELTVQVTNPKTGRITRWELIGKSYESKDTKWSSGAVDAIMLTEGITPAVLKEVKLRFKDPGVGSHDFTPYLPANAGAASALAQRIQKGTEPLPLKHFVFMEFSVYDAPTHIITEDKRLGLIESFKDDPEGEARLLGKFYSSSALVLSHLSREVHLLPFSKEEMFQMWPSGRIHRGVDPGLDHPTACVWGYLLPTNQWIIYRAFAKQGLTIHQRCKTIIEMSNNVQSRVQYGKRKEDAYYIETHPNEDSEIAVSTPIDFHIFKEDENTGIPYSLNYQLAGLPITESVHTKPEDRAMLFNQALEPSPFLPHLLTGKPPGPKVFFLQNEPGVMEMFLKFEELYWDRIRSGDNKGLPKDKVPTHGDDELDAAGYIIGTNIRWTSYRPPARIERDSEPEEDMIQYHQATLRRGAFPEEESFATIAKPTHREIHRFGK